MDYAAMMEIWGWVSIAEEKQDQHILLNKNKYMHQSSFSFVFTHKKKKRI